MLADICISNDTLELLAGALIGLVISLSVLAYLGRQS